MDEAELRKLERLLDKDVLKENLARAGVFSLGYEFLQNSLIERPKAFFTMGGLGRNDEYKAEILRRYKDDKFLASALWFKEQGALSDADIDVLRDIRKHRTDIVHQSLDVILNTKGQVDETKLIKLFELLCKVDRWWLINFELPLNEEYDGHEIDPKVVNSGQMETLWFLIRSVYDLPSFDEMEKMTREAQ